jgi:hypothetical protein
MRVKLLVEVDLGKCCWDDEQVPSGYGPEECKAQLQSMVEHGQEAHFENFPGTLVSVSLVQE